MRGIVRSLYVALTTFVAICLPFFADLMGLIGAAGFTPMTFILPCVFWLKVCLVAHQVCCLVDLVDNLWLSMCPHWLCKCESVLTLAVQM